MADRLRIALSVDSIGPALTGIGRYTLELAQGVPADDRVSELDLVSGLRRIPDLSALLRPGMRKRRVWLPRAVRARIEGSRLRDYLYHAPNYFLPDHVETGIVTVHDLSVYRYPETHPKERLLDFERRFSRTLARARHIVTDSETMRQEIMAFAGLTKEQVSATHLGVSTDYRPRDASTCRAVLDRLGLDHGGYGLCVASLEPRKMIGQLIKAWQELPSDLRGRFPLVLAGAAGWRNEALLKDIEKGVGEGWLLSLGYVPEADLPILYAGARLFAFPSIYEGFGLPPVEAMASGVPVIAADRSCLPEVLDGAALLIDPLDLDGMVTGLEQALTDSNWREGAVTSGLSVAARYSWTRCVQKTVDIYQRFAK